MLSINVLECLAEFIFLYTGKTLQINEIQTYIEPKLIEKELMNSYKHGLITKEEVCDFVCDFVRSVPIPGCVELPYRGERPCKYVTL